MIDRQVAEILLQSAGPMDGRFHRALLFSQTEEHFFAVLRKKPGPSLHKKCFLAGICLERHRRADGVTIALLPLRRNAIAGPRSGITFFSKRTCGPLRFFSRTSTLPS